MDLYNDAVKRKEKLNKLEKNHLMGIMLNATKTKMSSNSHKIALQKIEKLIDDAVANRDRNNSKKLSFVDVGAILTDLRIFREIFPSSEELKNKSGPANDGKDKTSNNKNAKKYQNYKDIKSELKNVKNQEKRKRQEVDFYEQIWMILNPENREAIKSDLFAEFIKILFSPISTSVKDIASILKEFIQAAFFLTANQDTFHISPLTEKELSEEEIWPLEKLVREFLNMKENILAYQHIGNKSKKLEDDIKKLNKEQLVFQPNPNKRDYNSRSNFFEERLPALLMRDELKKQSLEERKKEIDEDVNKLI